MKEDRLEGLEEVGLCSECGEEAQVEVDQQKGYCESCGTNTVVSKAILYGLV